MKTNLLIFSFLIIVSLKVFSQNGVGVNTLVPKSSFDDKGSFGKTVTITTADITLSEIHSTLVCNNTSTITVTLPAASTCARRIYEIKRTIGSNQVVTIAGTIDGATNYLLNNPNQSITLFSDSTDWRTRDGAGDAWRLRGNAGTLIASDFLGTTDAQDLAFRTNNTEKVRVTSAGLVGIGVTVPTNRISLNGNATQTIGMERHSVAASGGNRLLLLAGGAFSGGTNLNGGELRLSSGTATGTGLSNITFHTATAGTTGTGDNAPTEKMIIRGNGNVGIGITPSFKLDVDGDINISLDNNLIVRGMSMLAKNNTGALMNIGQGSYMVWNQTNLSGGVPALGYTNFVNHLGTGEGGFTWNNTDNMTTFTDMMTLTMYNVTNPSLGIFTQTPNSNLEVNGSFAANVITTAVNIALDHTHHTVIITSGTPTISLPAGGPGSCPKRIYHITNTTGTPRTVGTNTYVDLFGTAVSTIPANTGISLVSDGTTWRRFK